VLQHAAILWLYEELGGPLCTVATQWIQIDTQYSEQKENSFDFKFNLFRPGCDGRQRLRECEARSFLVLKYIFSIILQKEKFFALELANLQVVRQGNVLSTVGRKTDKWVK